MKTLLLRIFALILAAMGLAASIYFLWLIYDSAGIGLSWIFGAFLAGSGALTWAIGRIG